MNFGIISLDNGQIANFVFGGYSYEKKWIAAAVTAAALLGLWGCDSTPKAKVYVQNVGEITGAGAIAVNDVFPGIVVSGKR